MKANCQRRLAGMNLLGKVARSTVDKEKSSEPLLFPKIECDERRDPPISIARSCAASRTNWVLPGCRADDAPLDHFTALGIFATSPDPGACMFRRIRGITGP
jgi:hypothetical protein